MHWPGHTDDPLLKPAQLLTKEAETDMAREESSVCVSNRSKLLGAKTDELEEGTTTRFIMDAEETDTAQSAARCGTTRFCQTLCRKNPLTFTLATSLCFLTQISMVIFIVSQITSLEKEFGFSSSQTARIMSAAQIGSLCLVLPSGYLASRLHVPRAMAVAALVFGVVSVLAGLPRFLFPSASGGVRNSSAAVSAADVPPALCWVGEGAEGEERCEGVGAVKNRTSDTGETTEAVYNPRAYPVYVFLIVCQVVRGAVGATSFPFFVEYIETNAPKTDTGFYTGIVSSVAMLGPALAFLGGGAISKLHVSLQPTDLSPTHPDWVGAWWLGFLLFGSLAAVAPVFVSRFPRRLAPPPPPSPPPSPLPLARSSMGSSSPSSSASRRESESSQREGESGRQKLEQSCLTSVRRAVLELRGFLLSLVRLLVNPVYVLMVFASCFFGFSMNSTYLFLPKYMQDQFQMPAWKANFIMGGAELSVGTSGFLVGGWMTKRLKLTRRSLYKLLLALTAVVVLLVVAIMFVGCPQPTLIGAPGHLEHSDNCTLSCACPEEVFPICDQESRETYFSPCHAGCSDFRDGVYMNCSCTASGQAYPGECTSECTSVYYFSVIFFVIIFLISVSGPCHYLLVVRSVSTQRTALAAGLNGFVTGIVSFLVGPIVFGGIIDSFCDHWKTPCGVKGQCSVYNKDRFRVEMQAYSVVSISLSILCCFLSFLLFIWCPGFSTSSPDDACTDKKHVHSQAQGGDQNASEEPQNLLAPQQDEAAKLRDSKTDVAASDPSLS